MVVGRGWQAELGEDGSDVGLDCFRRQEQALADGVVRAALGDEGEDVLLAAGEVGQGAAVAPVLQQPSDYVRVNDRSAAGDLPDGIG